MYLLEETEEMEHFNQLEIIQEMAAAAAAAQVQLEPEILARELRQEV